METVPNKKIRRSKRQAGLEVSPAVSLTQKNKQKIGPDVNTADKDGDKTAENEKARESLDTENDQMIDEEAEEYTQHEEEEIIPPANRSGSNASESQSQQSCNTKRKTRGPTRMRKVGKSIADKVEVDFNAIGNHVGRGSVTLSSFVGIIVREHVSVLLDDWRHLDERTKEMMWEEVQVICYVVYIILSIKLNVLMLYDGNVGQGRFNLNEDWHKGVILGQMCNLWRSSKSRLVAKIRNLKSKSEILELKPTNIPCASAWMSWVKSKQSTAFQVM